MENLSISDEKYGEELVLVSEESEIENVSLATISKDEHLSEALDSLRIKEPSGQLRKKLLVLDINGLLADIVYSRPTDRKPDTYIARRAIFKRPFCLEFLMFCFEKFEVGVWSSRNKKNVEMVIDYLMGDMKHKLLFCWNQSHCTATQFKTLENKHKTLVLKELRKIWENNDPELPWQKGDYNESNTLLLDDSPYKGLGNPPHSAIFPYSYEYWNQSDNCLGPGGDLRVYLEELAETDNVQKFVERQPFGQEAISQKSESWEFYFQVISALSLPTGP